MWHSLCNLEHEVFQEVYKFLDIGLRNIFFSLMKVMSLTFHIIPLEFS
jgi:hypothetical protein